MDKRECVNADWYAVGLEDGARGRALERLGDHRRACAEHGVQPHTERYLAGRGEGLKSFCTYEKGYAQGRAGQGYAGTCPAELGRSFLSGYGRGKALHDLERDLKALNEQIRKSKLALKEGIRDPRERSREVERLENLTREAAQLEQALAAASSRR